MSRVQDNVDNFLADHGWDAWDIDRFLEDEEESEESGFDEAIEALDGEAYDGLTLQALAESIQRKIELESVSIDIGMAEGGDLEWSFFLKREGDDEGIELLGCRESDLVREIGNRLGIYIEDIDEVDGSEWITADRLLFKAIADDNASLAEEMIREDDSIDPNAMDNGDCGIPLLHFALVKDMLTVAELLVEKGADPDLQVMHDGSSLLAEGDTAKMVAAERGMIEFLDFLSRDSQAPEEADVPIDYSLLPIAAANTETRAVEAMLAGRGSLDKELGEKALFSALLHGADLDEGEDFDPEGTPAIVDLLAGAGVDLKARYAPRFGVSVLHACVDRNSDAAAMMLEHLLERGLSLDMTDNFDRDVVAYLESKRNPHPALASVIHAHRDEKSLMGVNPGASARAKEGPSL